MWPSPISASQWRHTGLSQSKSRCVSHVAARTIGGPLPWTAYASRTPSPAVQKRTCCATRSTLLRNTLGVADVLDPQPLAAEAIARAVGARASQLRHVLRALVATGVFCELEDGRFASNEAAAALRAGAPGGMRDVVLNFGEEMYRSFGELLHTVRTGDTAFDGVYGAPLVEYYAVNPGAEASAAARMLSGGLPSVSNVCERHLSTDGLTA